MKRLLLLFSLSIILIGTASALTFTNNENNSSSSTSTTKETNNTKSTSSLLTAISELTSGANKGSTATSNQESNQNISSNSNQINLDNRSKKISEIRLEAREYTLFSTIGGHLKELIKDKDYFTASKLFNKYQLSYFKKESFFGGKRPFDELRPELNMVVDGLYIYFESDINNNIAKLKKATKDIKESTTSFKNDWQNYKSLISTAESLSKEYKRHNIFFALGKKEIREHRRANWALARTLEEFAVIEFERYDSSGGGDFFSEYPVFINKSRVITASSNKILRMLNESTLDESIDLINKYNLKSSSEFKNKLAGILLDKYTNNDYGNASPSFADIHNIKEQIKSLGINVDESELPEKYRPHYLIIDQSKDWDDIAASADNKSPYLVIVDKRRVKVTKSEGRLTKIKSKYVSSRSRVSNPKYSQALNSYNYAVDKYNAALSNYKQIIRAKEIQRQERQRAREIEIQRQNSRFTCTQSLYGNTMDCEPGGGLLGYVDLEDEAYSAGALFGEGIAGLMGLETNENAAIRALDSMKTRLRNAESKLNRTPREVEQLNHTEYAFTTKTYDIEKNYEYRIININKSTKNYSRTSVPLITKESFVISENIHPQDANHKLTNFQTVDDIKIFIEAAPDIDNNSLSELLLLETTKSYKDLHQLLWGTMSAYIPPKINSNSTKDSESDSEHKEDKKTSTSNSDYIQDLERIKKLLDNGVINQDDYETLKQKIIDKI